jgi:hypothetical protein
MRKMPPRDHPLEAITLKAMENDEAQDAIKLAIYLAGRLAHGPLLTAYKKVAQDVLDNLEARGLAVRDGHGWYYLVKAARKGARAK